jgi:hypothetical protein
MALLYNDLENLNQDQSYRSVKIEKSHRIVPWLPEVRVSFALFPLVFILREAKRTSGGTRYKSHFHAELPFENLQNRFSILWLSSALSKILKISSLNM